MTPVVIIGGGPSGAAAALTLLDAQIAVTVVERKSFPRFHPGETLHPGVEPLLAKLGVAHQVQSAEYVRHLGVWAGWGGTTQLVPYGADEHGPWLGYQAIRADFDHRLLESARARGAEIRLGKVSGVLCNASKAVVGIITSEGPIGSAYVIDCSGSSQTLARLLHIPVVRHSPQLIARFGYVTGRFDDPSPSIRSDQVGWTWIAEVEPNRFQWTRVTEAHYRSDRTWIPPALRGLAPELSHGADVTWRMATTVAGPGYFLAGDSAVVLDPSSSHGVLRAMMSGMMAAHLVAQHLRGVAEARDCASTYQDWLMSWFQHDVVEMSRAYRSAKLFGFSA